MLRFLLTISLYLLHFSVKNMDGDIIECFRMEHEVPEWNSDTKWPQSALDIMSTENMEMLEESL